MPLKGQRYFAARKLQRGASFNGKYKRDERKKKKNEKLRGGEKREEKA